MRPGLALVAALAAPLPAMGAPVVELETIAQIRHDLFGERFVPVWQLIRLDHPGEVSLEGYAGVEWSAGLDRPPDPDVYLLAARGALGDTSWSAGRIEAWNAMRRQTLDGVGLSWGGAEGWSFEATLGVGRHQDLNDLLDGAALARFATAWGSGPISLRAGVQGELGPATPAVARQDLELRVVPEHRLQPWVGSRVVIAEHLPGEDDRGMVLEWGRLEGGARPMPGLRADLHIERRQVVDPGSLFGDAILHDFALGAVDQAGARVRWTGPRRASMSGAYALSSYPGSGGSDFGHSIDVSWLPSRKGPAPVPAYMFRSGPGGVFHALSASSSLPVKDAWNLGARAGLVPYRKGHDPWAVAATMGAELGRRLGARARFATQADVAADAVSVLDLRAGGVLVVELQ